jgi:hypothetical protein
MHKKAELIYTKWTAELADRDRSRPAVEGNFELFFDELQRAKIKMDDALPYLDKAIKAHYPSDFMVKRTYQKVKKFGRAETQSEFEKSWKDYISNTGKRVFFAFYDIEGTTAPTKTISGMSRVEYVKLQKYADSHETVDWEAIIEERDIAEVENDEPDIDVEGVDINIDLGEL